MTGPFVELTHKVTGQGLVVNVSRIQFFIPACMSGEGLPGSTEIYFDYIRDTKGNDSDGLLVRESYDEVRQKLSDALFAVNTGEVWR